MKVRSTVAILALAIASATHADDVTTTRAWKNCEGGEGVWAEMRISGCSEVIKGGQAEGETLAHAYYNRANAWLQKAEYRKAIDDYSVSLKLAPEDASALHERCWARAVAKIDLEDALSDCNKSLRLKPNDAETLSGRAFLYMRLGFHRTAVLDYEAAVEADPKNALALFGRGKAKAAAGDEEGGKADRAAARVLDPNIDALYDQLEAGEGGGGMWGAMLEYWRAAMQWLY